MTNGPALGYRAFHLSRRGNSAAEYEDACAGNVAQGRFAIADGASESSFAELWARLLVEAFVQTPFPQPGPWSAWLPPLQQRWAAEVGAAAPVSGQPLPWYVEAKVAAGAFATFLGLVVDQPRRLPGKHTRWQAIAVGDSCVFQVRKGNLYKAFPLTRSEDFANTPWLVGSRDPTGEGLERKGIRGEGEWRTGDRFWMMTDALAQWFLRQHEVGNKPWEALELLLAAPAPDEAFAAWIGECRDSRELRNDDVTLMAVCM